jgi:hypothetical protein
MKNKEKIIEQLTNHRTKAPEGFTDRVMDGLPKWGGVPKRRRKTGFWPAHGRWIAPAFAGAAAMFLVVFMLGHFKAPTEQMEVGFHFELHAPGAKRVELLGSFNSWETDDIVLTGPDASGHWTATVSLPEGSHEYIFLVDGERWIADPKAATHRPDGFGRVNSVIKIYEDEDALQG